MSLNLLSTSPSGTSRFTSRFINNESTSSSSHFITCEYDRILYMVDYNESYPYTFRFQTYNIQTGEMKLLGSITRSEMSSPNGTSPGDMKCNGKYIFLSFTSSTNIVKININNLSDAVKYNSTITYTCWAQSLWYDDTKIMIRDRRGWTFFDTETYEFTYEHYYTSDDGRNGFAIGKKLWVSTNTNLKYYNPSTKEVKTVSLPMSTYNTWVTYGEGKFYVCNKAYMFIFDEETESWDSTYLPIPFGRDTPQIIYAEGLVYILPAETNKLWVYDIEANMYSYMFLPWTTRGIDYKCRLTVFHRYLFFQFYTFAFINFAGVYKYNIGYKFNQLSLSFAKESCDYVHKDPYLILEDAYLTMEDTTDVKPLYRLSEGNPKIKYGNLQQSDYGKIKSIKIK